MRFRCLKPLKLLCHIMICQMEIVQSHIFTRKIKPHLKWFKKLVLNKRPGEEVQPKSMGRFETGEDVSQKVWRRRRVGDGAKR